MIQKKAKIKIIDLDACFHINKNNDVSVNYFLLSKADSDKMRLLVIYIKEIIELDNIHYSKNVLYQINP
ncbi:hypothetical protein BpHYR1_037855 [Brachionus plicatilis]|uniref:Uncharacterized protein n=1 Tax=Brachionus plicatilis TaxID=10195 RepID=A0A3M7RQV8_BRAPC|nr:hypothetical protein BpHYR1_037855 [Brachionus plicatilis]